MERTARRWVGGMVRAGLIAIAILLIATWLARRLPNRGRISVQREPVAEETLMAGDLRIYNRDSTVDLILKGNQILAGLSPKTVAKVKAEMEKSSAKDSTGIGGLIASTVKQTVASTIGTHVAYPLSDVRDMRFEDGQLIIERRDGGKTRPFGDTKINGDEKRKSFSAADAKRFIEAVRARKSIRGTP